MAYAVRKESILLEEGMLWSAEESVREHAKSGSGSVGSTAFFLLCEDSERR